LDQDLRALIVPRQLEQPEQARQPERVEQGRGLIVRVRQLVGDVDYEGQDR